MTGDLFQGRKWENVDINPCPGRALHHDVSAADGTDAGLA